jgi:hypothetical protein
MRTVRHGFFFLLVVGALICGSAPLTVSARQAGSKAAATSGAKVDLNTASEKDLEDLPGVGPATAKKIIAGRPYSSVDGLSKAGVPARTIGKISSLVTVSGAAAAAPAPAAAPKSTAKASAPVSQPAPAAAAPSQPPAPATPSKPAPAASASQGSPGAGMVWVNLETGVYHYQSSRYYGKTKSGKYMSEADAIKAGYHAAKNEKKS